MRRCLHGHSQVPQNQAPTVATSPRRAYTARRWRSRNLKWCEGAGGEEVLAHGGVEVLEGVGVLLLPVRGGTWYRSNRFDVRRWPRWNGEIVVPSMSRSAVSTGLFVLPSSR